MKRAGALIALLASLPAVAHADDENFGTIGPAQAAGIARINGIGREVEKLGDWDTLYNEMAPGVDAFWQQQGWDEEADDFALDTFHQVASVPPWQVQQRVSRLLGAVRTRYDLTEDQYLELQTRTYSFLGAMAWRHGRTMYRQTKEAVDTRLQGQPFTPEQVARWTQDSRALIDDARAQVDRIAGEFARSFSPHQREIYERDMASYRRRMEAIDQLRKRWEAGAWRPEDWGLQNDPAYRRLETAEEPELDDGLANGINPVDETAWARYVRNFVHHYGLDDAQATAAWSILDELLDRADDYRRLHRDRIARATGDRRVSSDLDTAISDLFEELQRRLRPIPTSAQRIKARRGDVAPSPTASPVPQKTDDGDDAYLPQR